MQSVLASAVGGENVTTTVEGRERYAVNVRYLRDFRNDIGKLNRVLVPVMGGRTQVPVSELAAIRIRPGPSMIREENGLLTGYVYVDVAGRDVGGYVEEAKRVVRDQIQLPAGYAISWSGQYERWSVSAAPYRDPTAHCLLILLLLYLNTKSFARR